MTLDDLDLFAPGDLRPGAAPRRKCRRHEWTVPLHTLDDGPTPLRLAVPKERVDGWQCARCGAVKDAVVSRRSRNNRLRGVSDELAVANLLGGRKIGPLGYPWDVEVPGYLRAQCKKLAAWPSVNEIVRWLDAIPAGPELRAVTLADTPGHGGRTRRLIVMDLEEYARWHGREPK